MLYHVFNLKESVFSIWFWLKAVMLLTDENQIVLYHYIWEDKYIFPLFKELISLF